MRIVLNINDHCDNHCAQGTARRAFTLIDLVVTMLIIGILTAVAAPKFASALHRTRVEQAAKRIQIDLRYARQNAISRSSNLIVQFNSATDSYTIPALPDLNRPGRPYSVALQSAPYSATLVSASLGLDSDILFDRFGNPDSGGTITVASGGYLQTVTIDPETGKAASP